MPQPQNGPGVGLPLAQYLYPSELTNAPIDFSSNRLALAPGEFVALPAGDWYVDLGMYCVLQFLDPVTNAWSVGATAGFSGGIQFIKSDGFNCRVANLLGCPIGAVVTGAGTLYAQSSTTIVPSVGNSAWSPIVGGALSVSSITAAGGGFGIPPLVLIPAPPPAGSNANGVGGVPAEAYAVLTSGSVSAISWVNQGAGYPSPPIATIVPSPYDPNINSGITAASVTLGLTGAGTLTGAICTNSGAALTNAQLATGLTLTVSGAGSGATLSAIVMQTVVALTTVSTPGAGYGTGGAKLTTSGGVPAVSSLVTPTSLRSAWRPRPADILLATSASITSVSAIYDGGLFEGTPTPIILSTGIPTTVGVVTLTMGSVPDHVILQPAP